jgi:hypothetical protein
MMIGKLSRSWKLALWVHKRLLARKASDRAVHAKVPMTSATFVGTT